MAKAKAVAANKLKAEAAKAAKAKLKTGAAVRGTLVNVLSYSRGLDGVLLFPNNGIRGGVTQRSLSPNSCAHMTLPEVRCALAFGSLSPNNAGLRDEQA